MLREVVAHDDGGVFFMAGQLEWFNDIRIAASQLLQIPVKK